MNRRLRGLLPLGTALVALALMIAACETDDGDEVGDPADEGEDEPEVEITFGHPFPAEHPMMGGMLDPWMAEVEEQTGGSVTFDVHPGGALAAPDAIYENTVAGAMDMGWALHGYTPGRFPITRLIELPFVWDDAEQATEGLWDLYEEFDEFQAEFDDTHVLALWTHDIGDLWTVDQPVEAPEDLEGLELRAPGPEQSNLVAALGGDPVGLPAPELFDALDGGVIDGLMIANSGLRSFDLFPTLQYGTQAGFYVGTQYVVMNPDTWEQLSPSQQEVLTETSQRELSLTGARAYDDIYDDLQEQIQDDLDVTTIEGADLEEWQEATEDVPQQWIDDQDADVPAEEMHQRLLEISGQD